MTVLCFFEKKIYEIESRYKKSFIQHSNWARMSLPNRSRSKSLLRKSSAPASRAALLSESIVELVMTTTGTASGIHQRHLARYVDAAHAGHFQIKEYEQRQFRAAAEQGKGVLAGGCSRERNVASFFSSAILVISISSVLSSTTMTIWAIPNPVTAGFEFRLCKKLISIIT
jgi:hypothetical protein